MLACNTIGKMLESDWPVYVDKQSRELCQNLLVVWLVEACRTELVGQLGCLLGEGSLKVICEGVWAPPSGPLKGYR